MRKSALLAALLLTLAAPVHAQQMRPPEPPTLEKLKKDYAEVEQEEPRVNKVIDEIGKLERDLIILMGKATQADEEAARHPEDAALRKTADELSAHVKKESEAQNQRKVQAQRELNPYHMKLQKIYLDLNALEKKNPADEDVQRFKVVFLVDRGAVTMARDEVDKLWAKHQDDRDVRFAYAESRMVAPLPARGPAGYRPPDFSEAFTVIEPLAKAEPTNMEVQLLYGVAASATDHNAVAATVLGGIADITSIRPAVRILLGNAEDPEAAFATWRDTAKGLEKDPADTTLRMKRAELLLAVDANDRAIAEGETVMKTKPDDHAAVTLLARAYTFSKKFDEAGKLYEKLGAEMEKSPELRAEHALYLIAAQKQLEGLAELMKIPDLEKLPPKLFEMIVRSVNELRANKELETEAFVISLRIQTDQQGFAAVGDHAESLWHAHKDDARLQTIFAEACVNMGSAPSRGGRPPMPAPPPRFARAHALLAPLLAKTPEDKELLLVDGVACVALGQDALAAKELDAVATVDSMRGSLRGLLGKHGFPEWKALADGLAAKPEDGELRKKRAELLDSVHAAPPLVARDYEAALRAKPDDVELKKSLARAYRAANHYEKAIPLFKELPDADEIHAECAVCLIAVSRFAEAKEEIAKIKDPHKLPPQIGSEFLSLSTQVDKLVPLWEDEKKFREADAKKDDNPKLQLETEKGKIVLELFEDTAPNTVANIISLSETGYYNGVKFHRIIAGFMAQGGDPQGTGMGGPGYTIKDELKGNPRFHWRGTLSMAHAGPNTGGSQFFLCYSPTPHLNEKHTVFGRIIEGQEVADELERGDEIVKATVLRKRDHEYKVETHAAQRPPMRLPPGSVHPH